MELEIQAMAQCYEALKPLNDDAQKRVIQWLIGKFALHTMTASAMVVDAKQVAVISHGQMSLPAQSDLSLSDSTDLKNTEGKPPGFNGTIESFENVAELFASIKPEKEWEKALVVASYLQLKKNLNDLTSFDVNKELKNLGHGTKHINEAMQANIDRKPQLILQLRKEGKSQQARKKYKVSTEGLNHVRKMLEANHVNSGN